MNIHGHKKKAIKIRRAVRREEAKERPNNKKVESMEEAIKRQNSIVKNLKMNKRKK